MPPRSPSPRSPSRQSLTVLSMILVCGLLAGCAGTHRTGGSSLSEAAEEAKKSPGEKRKLLEAGEAVAEDGDDCDSSGLAWFIAELILSSDDDQQHDGSFASGECRDERGWDEQICAESEGDDATCSACAPQRYLGLSVGGSTIGAGALEGAGRAGVRYGQTFPGSAGRLHGELEAMIAATRFERAHVESFTSGTEFALGGALRYDLTPRQGGPAAHLLLGARAGFLSWRYANPLWIEQTAGDVVSTDRDHLGTFTPYAGFGVSFVRTPTFRLGASLIGGRKFFAGHTKNGLLNDVYTSTYEAELRLELLHFF